MPNPENVAKVLQTLRPYFRRLQLAWGEQRWRQELALWFDVEREVTAADEQMRAVDKEDWLAALAVMERELFPANDQAEWLEATWPGE